MKTFTIEHKTNNIILHATRPDARAVRNAAQFGNEAALAKLAANWPTARLVEIWNSLPGEIPVKKFKDRATAVARIWNAIQNLAESAPPNPEPLAPAAPVAPHAPGVAPSKASATPNATPARKLPTVQQARRSRPGTKTEEILDLLKRPGGASLQEIMHATGWQAHSVRGFLSGTVGKKMSLTLVSTKTQDGHRSYALHC